MTDDTYYIRSRGRLSGPVSSAELRRLQRRGVLSRADEVSTDGATWSSIGELPAADGSGKSAGSRAAAERRHEMGSVAPPLLYYRDGPDTVGPVPTLLLQALARQGKISPTTVVWQDGGVPQPAYGLAELRGCFAENTSPRPQAGISGMVPLAIGVFVTLVCLIVSVQWLTQAPPRPSAPSASPMMTHTPAPRIASDERLVITNVQQENEIAEAVGFVVIGLHLAGAAGQVVELPIAQGSCFAVSSNGDLLTNRHVVDPVRAWQAETRFLESLQREEGVVCSPSVWVFFSGRKYLARIVSMSSRYDAAVLKIDCQNQPFFRLSAAASPPRNTDVIALGFPYIAMNPVSEVELLQQLQALAPAQDIAQHFRSRDYKFSLTRGVLGRSYEDSGGVRYLQHEAVIRSGNSGGPLVTHDGLVVGVNTLRQTDDADVQTNLSLEISQLRDEIDAVIGGAVWHY